MSWCTISSPTPVRGLSAPSLCVHPLPLTRSISCHRRIHHPHRGHRRQGRAGGGALHLGGAAVRRPVGLVFLFKYESNHGEDAEPPVFASEEDGLLFAKHMISNACATQTILSILLNCQDIELGETLSEFKSDPFVVEERKATEDHDVYHFVAYVPVNGQVYELDGLREGPICLGGGPRDSWLQVACPVIQKRVEKYAASEIRFNFLALVRNRIQAYEEQLQAIIEGGGSEQQAAQIQADLASEEQKRENWALENKRRKHNGIPFIIQLLKTLAEKKPLIKQQLDARNAAAIANAAKATSAQ